MVDAGWLVGFGVVEILTLIAWGIALAERNEVRMELSFLKGKLSVIEKK